MADLTELDRRVQRNIPLLNGFSFLLGLRLYIPVWLVYFHNLGLTDVQSGQLWAIYFAASLLTDGLTGFVADRWGYRNSLMLGGLLMSVSFAGFYFGPASSNVWWCFVASMALFGVAATLVYNSTPQAFGSKSAAKVGRDGGFTRFLGMFSAVIYLGTALAAALAWVVIRFLSDGPRLVWAVQISLSLGLVVVAFATQDLDEFRPRRNHTLLCLRDTLEKLGHYARNHWRQLLMFLPLLVLALSAEPFAFTVQAYCLSVHLSPGWTAVTFAAGNFGTGLVALGFSRVITRIRPSQAIVALSILIPAGWLGMGCFPSWWQLTGVCALFLVCALPIIIVNSALDQIVREYKAAAISVFMTVKGACYVVLWPVMGWMFQHWHFRLSSLIMGLTVLASMLLLSPLLLIRNRSASLSAMCMPTPWAGQLRADLLAGCCPIYLS